jgi:hypothetical protein
VTLLRRAWLVWLAVSAASPLAHAGTLEAPTVELAGLTSQNLLMDIAGADRAVSLIRRIATSTPTAEAAEIAKVVPVLYRCSLMNAPSVAKEAEFALAGIGYGPVALDGYADLLRDADPSLRDRALRLIDSHTANNRQLLKGALFAELRDAALVDPGLLKPESGGQIRIYWRIFGAAELAPEGRQARLELLMIGASSMNFVPFAQDVTLASLVEFERVMAALEKALDGYEQKSAMVGVKHPTLAPFVREIMMMTGLLIRPATKGIGGWDRNAPSVWEEIRTLAPEAQRALTDRLVPCLRRQLVIIRRAPTTGGAYLASPYQILGFAPSLGRDALPLVPVIKPLLKNSVSGTREAARWTLREIKKKNRV